MNLPNGFEEISFQSKSGTLRGWIAPVIDPQANVVLMHGLRGSRTDMLSRIKFMNRLGLSALAFDFQAHGASAGSRITFGHLESYDAQAAVAYLQKRSPNLPIYVIGVSLGGAAALLSTPALRVDGMILEAVYPNIERAIANRLTIRIPYGELATSLFTMQIEPRLGIDLEDLSPETSARQIAVPVLVLGGSIDLHTTLENTHDLYNAFSGEKYLEIFPGAAHVNLHNYNEERYESVVARFLEDRIANDA